jgi:hypothetical protein
MATQVARNPRLVSAATNPEIVKVYAASGVAWGAGQWLRINTSGEAVAVANGATTGGITHQAITARATTDAAGYVYVLKCRTDMVWECNLTSGTASEALIGLQRGIDVSGTVVTIDPSSSETMVTVQDLGYNRNEVVYDSSDTLAIVYVSLPDATINMARQA